jgi:hypothetical protein
MIINTVHSKQNGPLVDTGVHNQIVHGNRLDCALAAAAAAAAASSVDGDGVDFGCDDSDLDDDSDVASGLACADNRTLNFYTLDSQTQSGLLQRLTGRPREDSGGNTAAVIAMIVDSEHETVYIMHEGVGFGAGSLARFVGTFHEDPSALRQLKRSYKSEDVESYKSEDESHKREDEEDTDVISTEELDLDGFNDINGSKGSSVILYQGRYSPNLRKTKSSIFKILSNARFVGALAVL